MAETNELTSNNGNGWSKFIIGALITVVLSVGGSIWSTGEANGTQKEKVLQLEIKVEKAEKFYATDHDIIVGMSVKLTNIENMLKQMQEAKTK